MITSWLLDIKMSQPKFEQYFTAAAGVEWEITLWNQECKQIVSVSMLLPLSMINALHTIKTVYISSSTLLQCIHNTVNTALLTHMKRSGGGTYS